MGDNYFEEQSNFTSEENLPSNLIKFMQFIQAKLSPGEVQCSTQGHTAHCGLNYGWKHN